MLVSQDQALHKPWPAAEHQILPLTAESGSLPAC